MASKSPNPLTVPVQAVANYFSDVTYSWTQLNGFSDDIVQSSSQCLTDDQSASECTVIPASKSLSSISDINLSHHLATPSLDQDVKNNPDCWVIPDTEPMLHFMSCLGHLVSVEYEIPALLISDTVPWVSSWSVSPTTLNLGGTVSISYIATDLSSSTLSRAELWRAPDVNGQPGAWVEVGSPQTLSGHGPTQIRFTDKPTGGSKYWYGTHLFDSAGNEATEPFPTLVTISGPDLTETSVTNPPGALLVGSGFSVTDTAKNIGNLTAAASITRYYVSTTTLKTSSSVLLTGSRSVPALAANAISSGTTTATIPSTTKPGTYYLLACTDDTKLIAESNEGNNCKASSGTIVLTTVGGDTIQLGQTVAEKLSTSAPAGHCRGRIPADRWQFTLGSTTTVTIEADSTAFDTDLCLLNSANNFVASDDNSGPGSNARIVYQNLSAGTYYIEVSSAPGTGGGAYTLSLTKGLPPGKAISVGQTLSSTLSSGEAKGACRGGIPADRWQFTLGSTTTVTIEADSTAFGTDPFLLNSANNFVASDDNSGPGSNARIVYQNLSAGTYGSGANI